MPKSTTSSFITEIPVKTGSHEEAILKKRFWAAKQQYNALLMEALTRLRKMRKDERYGAARELRTRDCKAASGVTTLVLLIVEGAVLWDTFYAGLSVWFPSIIGALLSISLSGCIYVWCCRR